MEKALYIFRYHVELEKGYFPVMGDNEEKDLFFDIQAKNRATADRMVRAMLIGNINVSDLSGICIGRVGEDIIYK